MSLLGDKETMVVMSVTGHQVCIFFFFFSWSEFVVFYAATKSVGFFYASLANMSPLS